MPDLLMMQLAKDLDATTRYRIPAASVSYHPILGNARVWFTGQVRRSVDGHILAEFRFDDHDRPTTIGYGCGQTIWLAPWAVTTED